MTDATSQHKGKGTFIKFLEFSLLLFLTVIVYHQVGGFDFISMDDPVYVTDNPYVNQGFTTEGVRWSLDFGHDSGPYWMPLTMVSHMADCEFFGLDPSKHHIHNLILHLLNTCLLFFFFYKVTGDYGKSLFISALFALHPLNVESVAWVTSRKNVLSTFFLLSTLLAYHRYIKQKDFSRYLHVFIFYFLGLTAKASVITLIFSLLLFDVWPFHRFLLFRDGESTGLKAFDRRNIVPILEKIPLLIVTGLILYLNFSKASFVHEATPMDKVGMGLRFANALVAYVVYMVQTFWPFNLSVHYPYPASVPLWKSIPAFAVLVSASVYALANLKRRPYVAVGWFFFVGNLVMVSGVIQGGLWPAHADRFMYVPGIGLFIILAYGFGERFKGSKAWAMGIVFCLVLAGFALLRAGDWKDSITLYTQALKVHPQDMVSTVNLAFALDKAGKGREALPYYEKIVERYPEYAEVHANMAVILAEQGKDKAALYHFEQAAQRSPSSVTIWFNKALFHERRNEWDQAGESLKKVLELQPKHAEALQRLGGIYIRNKDYDKAAELYEQAVLAMPEASLSIRYNLACVYALKNDKEKSLKYLREIVADGFDKMDVMRADEQLENVKETVEFNEIVGEAGR
ncbi:MAG: tetratricopeptide repeat protein [Desulfobacteraceae bacterium]|jgi:Flp pilus assembly protein TadD